MYGNEGFGMDYSAPVPTMDDVSGTSTVAGEIYAVADLPTQGKPDINLIAWFEDQGWQGYTSASSFKELLDGWQPSDWQQLMEVVLDSQIVKDASPQSHVAFKDYLYARQAEAAERMAAAQSAYVPTQAQVDVQNAHRESGIVSGEKPEDFKMSALKKIFPMPVVQLGLGGVGYVIGDKLKMPILGTTVGIAALPLYKSRIPKVIDHSKQAMGALLGSTDEGGDTGNDEPPRRLLAMLPVGIGTIAMALSYYRNKSVLRSVGAGFIAPIYLTYIGIEYLMGKKKGKK